MSSRTATAFSVWKSETNSSRRGLLFPWCRVGWWQFASGEHAFQLIDVVKNGDGVLGLEERNQLVAAWAVGRSDANKRHGRGPGAASVVHGVANIPDLAAAGPGGDLEQSFRRGLVRGDVFHADDRIEAQQRRAALQ